MPRGHAVPQARMPRCVELEKLGILVANRSISNALRGRQKLP